MNHQKNVMIQLTKNLLQKIPLEFRHVEGLVKAALEKKFRQEDGLF